MPQTRRTWKQSPKAGRYGCTTCFVTRATRRCCCRANGHRRHPRRRRRSSFEHSKTRFGDEIRPIAVRLRDDWSRRDLAVPLMHHVDGEMHQPYDADQASVYLVRPDGYVGFRAGVTNPTGRECLAESGTFAVGAS
jgi:hypothetical protein